MPSEFDFIREIQRKAAAQSAADLVLGIGDDAAVWREQTGRETLTTVDLLVEDVDFKLEYAPPRWLGHKALAVSLSDIAAMGGVPMPGRWSLSMAWMPVCGSTWPATAAAFGGLSLWGYTTKRDLSGFGVFLFMGLLGIIIASIVNIFMKSDMMEFIISIAGVVIFAGLTAFDTQKLKYQYYQLGGDSRSMAVATNYGALNLYLDFINLFQFIMSLLSRR